MRFAIEMEKSKKLKMQTLKIGKLPRSVSEIAKMNNLIHSEVVIAELKRLHREGKVTPIFDEQHGIKVCLWKRVQTGKGNQQCP